MKSENNFTPQDITDSTKKRPFCQMKKGHTKKTLKQNRGVIFYSHQNYKGDASLMKVLWL